MQGFSAELLRTRPKQFDLRRGVLDAILILTPLVVGFALGLAEAAVIVSIGALNFALVEAPTPKDGRGKVLAVTVVANSAAFGAGTLVGLTPVEVEIPLVAAGVFVALLGVGSSRWELTSFIAAVMFSFAVGIPPTTLAGVVLRPLGVLLGGTWCLLAFVLLELSPKRLPARMRPKVADLPPARDAPVRVVVGHGAVVALTVVVGLLIGARLGLPRDYWVMVTVLVALRFDLVGTLSISVARILGTIVGAAGAFVVTTLTADPWILFPILAATTALTIASRAVNYVVYAVWVTLTIILLLNLVYSGGPQLAIARVIDTVIGGGLAMVAVLLLTAARRRPRRVHNALPHAANRAG